MLPNNDIRGIGRINDRDAGRRKLAVGRAILAEGPVSLARITALCREAGVPIEGTTWPTTLVRTRFLAGVGGHPRRWTLTERGRVWVTALVAGEQVVAEAARVAR